MENHYHIAPAGFIRKNTKSFRIELLNSAKSRLSDVLIFTMELKTGKSWKPEEYLKKGLPKWACLPPVRRKAQSCYDICRQCRRG